MAEPLARSRPLCRTARGEFPTRSTSDLLGATMDHSITFIDHNVNLGCLCRPYRRVPAAHAVFTKLGCGVRCTNRSTGRERGGHGH